VDFVQTKASPFVAALPAAAARVSSRKGDCSRARSQLNPDNAGPALTLTHFDAGLLPPQDPDGRSEPTQTPQLVGQAADPADNVLRRDTGRQPLHARWHAVLQLKEVWAPIP
jgi:hypothetical protein